MMPETTDILLEQEIPTNPFPGLRPFDFEESHLFFGRDGQSEQLISKLGATHFSAVVGTSGSGKSSLVRAGLMPALLGGFMTSAGSNWRIAVMRPGNDPVGNLARALNAPDVFGSEVEENAELQSALAEATLQRGSRGLVDAVRQAVIACNENLLVVVDQFEEIFRFARVTEDKEYRNEAAAFVKLLLEAARQREIPIYVVLTMRSDYLGDCSQFWELPEAINESQYLIPRLTRDQLKEATTGPITVAGGQITPRLIARLLNDVGEDQDQLPVLQHLLMRVWDECKEKRLTVEVNEGDKTITVPHSQVHLGGGLDLCCYDAVGGMAQALSRHADEALNELGNTDPQKGAVAGPVKIAEKLFKALTEKGTDNREIRRPATLGELCSITGADASQVIEVIETFRVPGRSFLMPPADIPLTAESLIDISHESLIRAWSRLKEWVEEESRSARIYRRLAETAVLESEHNAGLWGDPDLQIALTWRQQTQPNKTWAQRYHREFDLAMNFLDRSVEKRDAEIRDKEVQRRKAIKRTRWTAIVFGILFLFSLIALFIANQQRVRANGLLEEVQRNADKAKNNAIKEETARLAREDAERDTQIAENAKKESDAFAMESRKLADKAEAQRRIAEEQSRIAVAQTQKANELERKARQKADEAQAINDLTRQVNDDLGKKNVEGVISNAAKLAEYYKNKPDPRGEFESQTILASAYLQLGNTTEAQNAAKRALSIKTDNQIENTRNEHENLTVLRDAYLEEANKSVRQGGGSENQNALTEAFRTAQQALAVQEGSLGANNRAIIPDLVSLASISEKRSEPANVRGYRQRMVQVQKEAVRSDNSELAGYIAEQAKFNQAHGDYAKAAEQFNETLAIERSMLDADDPQIISTLTSLAEVYRAANNPEADRVVQQIQRLQGKDALLRKGASGPQVRALQQNLQKLGFFQGTIDDYFGEDTEKAVIKFQISQGLLADGIVGPSTTTLLEHPKKPSVGMEDVQAKLKELGFYSGAVDGDFGIRSQAALTSFQRSKGLPESGTITPETVRALGFEVSDSKAASVTGRVSAAVVSKMFPYAPIDNIKANLPEILHALEDAGLSDKEMVLIAITTIGIETGGTFAPTVERKSRFNTSADGHPFDLYDNRKDIGNDGPPDGERYKGRGYSQLTGKGFYKTYGEKLGLGDQLVQNPDLASDPEIAAKVIVQLLKDKESRIRNALTSGDLASVRRALTGGLSGAEQFRTAYQIGASLIQ